LGKSSIISDQIIDANVDYSAQNTIDLISAFEVILGRQFMALIAGCGN